MGQKLERKGRNTYSNNAEKHGDFLIAIVISSDVTPMSTFLGYAYDLYQKQYQKNRCQYPVKPEAPEERCDRSKVWELLVKQRTDGSNGKEKGKETQNGDHHVG